MRRRLEQIASALANEFGNFHFRLVVVKLFLSLLPPFVGGRIRSAGLRLSGLEIGRGALFLGTPLMYGPGNFLRRLSVGERSIVSYGCAFDLADEIVIGCDVGIGPEVMIITGGHQIGPASRRLGELRPARVVIGDGAWIGSRATIMPGVTIGAGAVVGAGTVVAKDVPKDTLVFGNRSLTLKQLQ